MSEREQAERLSEEYVAPLFPRKYENLAKACETLMLYEVRDEVQVGFEAGFNAGRESVKAELECELKGYILSLYKWLSK